ncbi:hypothetical protein BFP76_00605 [Amylibacter kogurei]|uniref:Sulfotransferase domain-containing protein n=1 Tax=Paramylibacter kogurei TaxID=1889778 RepID=A0A2G5K806_9RHOB|nr:sulfotransferase [Amylibacter kogurei]PIB25667.1 hypothetical protein BFP76_00605 [Amylibacter kogurei]
MVYCIGAAKAGTTWLHHTLNNHPDTHFQFIKEIHYFNSREWPMAKRLQRAKFSPKHRVKLAINPVKYLNHRAYAKALCAEQDDHRSYKKFILRGAGSAKVVGDFTPAYATLGSKDFAAMSDAFARSRFLYLLRDPVDRAWSHIRMLYHRHNATQQIDMAKMDNMLSRLLAGKMPYLDQHGNYDQTINAIANAGLSGSLNITFYENLFEQNTMDEVYTFIGLTSQKINPQKRIFEGIDSPMPEHIRSALMERYQGEYRAIFERFGTLPARWQNHFMG